LLPFYFVLCCGVLWCAGKQLSPEVLTKTEQGCAMALQLDEDKQQVSVHIHLNPASAAAPQP
jgi:hypothetical protein